MKDKSAKPAVSFGRRAASYWFVDGFPELLFGLTLVVMAGLAFLFGMEAPEHRKRFYFLIVYVVLLLYLFSERRVLDFLKARFTYPRTGYVQPPEESEWSVGGVTTLSLLRPEPRDKENVTFFRLRTVGPIWLILFVFVPHGEPIGRWFAPLVTPALAVTLYAVNRGSERPYRWWSALILALAGLVFVWVPVPGPLQWPLPFLLAGVWLAAQGGYTLVNYLRINPHPRTPEGAQA